MRFVSAILMAGMLAGAVLAAPGPKEDKSDKVSIPEKIRAALDQTGNFNFTENNNLGQVLTTVGEEYKIPIVLDKAVVMQMGFDPMNSMPVQTNLKNVKLRTFLRTVVGEYNLTTAILNDCLLVTTEEMAVYRQLKQRVSMEYEDVVLTKALKDISTKYGVNIVIDPKAVKSKAAETKVTLQVDDVPVEAAVRLLCEMAELKPARMGNVILITTEARADKLKDSNSLVPAPALPGMPGGPFAMPFGPGGLGGGVGGVQVLPAVPAPAVDLPAIAPPAGGQATPPAPPPPDRT